MAQPNRPVSSALRHPSIGGLQSSTGQSPVLLARISEKKAELENLKQLRDLSGGLAAQMQALEEKLSTLSDGTEGKDLNLRACTFPTLMRCYSSCCHRLVQLAQCHESYKYGFEESDDQAETTDPEHRAQLPQTLVRIPIEGERESPQALGTQGKSTES
ncbi:uncharacterized protein KY384_007006 [Bacidia gigantensis]|uniref:uncharacterized protein n=1 Tax=Bacidia gigantensis TaxID=2732470 RepID=UPI001D05B1B9|nr:uncharacterized protein KY384_007006 [Bacidia gigantensis]KAG8528090.1 hypothetical protein KY384_007006 [Bacidia gigantensis]